MRAAISLVVSASGCTATAAPDAMHMGVSEYMAMSEVMTSPSALVQMEEYRGQGRGPGGMPGQDSWRNQYTGGPASGYGGVSEKDRRWYDNQVQDMNRMKGSLKGWQGGVRVDADKLWKSDPNYVDAATARQNAAAKGNGKNRWGGSADWQWGNAGTASLKARQKGGGDADGLGNRSQYYGPRGQWGDEQFGKWGSENWGYDPTSEKGIKGMKGKGGSPTWDQINSDPYAVQKGNVIWTMNKGKTGKRAVELRPSKPENWNRRWEGMRGQAWMSKKGGLGKGYGVSGLGDQQRKQELRGQAYGNFDNSQSAQGKRQNGMSKAAMGRQQMNANKSSGKGGARRWVPKNQSNNTGWLGGQGKGKGK